MGRVSTCQKNCKTIDLRGAQVNNTHSGQQSPICDVSKPRSSTWNLHLTDMKIQKFDEWEHDTKLNSTQKTGHQQGQPEWSRAPQKSVSDIPSAKAGSHSDRTELG